MTDVLRRGSVGFLERGRWRHGTAALGLVAVAGTAGSVYCGVQAIHYQRAAAAERSTAQIAIAALRDELGGAKQALSAAQERLGDVKDQARGTLAASEQAVISNTDRIAQLTRSLDQVQRALRLAEVQRATLMARLSRSEVESAQDQARRKEEMRADQDQLEKKLRQLTADREKIEEERNKAESERDRLRARVGQLEQKLSLQNQQPPAQLANSRPAPRRRPPRPMSRRRASRRPAAARLPKRQRLSHAGRGPDRAGRSHPAPVATTPAPVALSAGAGCGSAGSGSRRVVSAGKHDRDHGSSANGRGGSGVTGKQHDCHCGCDATGCSGSGDRLCVAAAQPQRPAALAAVPAVARSSIAQVERVLASAGVDVKNLFAQFGVNRGLGGPYIPNPRGVQPEQLSAEKLEALSRMVKSLPVAAPLHSYEIGSRFGVRGDPMNAHLALHTGTDFRAPYDSPVYATAAGTVTFSGYRADYGKIVEIDHGNGFATRYGHLNRATVSVGQRVAAQTQIGFLGSTGRATGPHVHYEVVVNGEPQDPEKFMGLGRIVPVVAQR